MQQNRVKKILREGGLALGTHVGGIPDPQIVELMRSFVADYNKAGGNAELQLYEGANHGFMTGKPDAPYAALAIERMKQFIRKHTTG